MRGRNKTNRKKKKNADKKIKNKHMFRYLKRQYVKQLCSFSRLLSTPIRTISSLSKTSRKSSYNAMRASSNVYTSQFYRTFSSDGEHIEVVPSLGDSISEGTVIEISKNVGDYVFQDEVFCIIETDKVTVDIPASQAGEITSIKVEEGDTVEIGDELASFNTSAEAPEGGAAATSSSATEAVSEEAATTSTTTTTTAEAPKKTEPTKQPPKMPTPTPSASGRTIHLLECHV